MTRSADASARREVRRAHGPPVTPEAELALLLIGTRARRDANAERLADLAAAVDQAVLANVLIEQRVFALAGTRFVGLARDGVTASFRERLETALARARVRAFGFSELTARVVGSLEDAGIAAVALKGSTLAAELHGDAALRHYGDIDVLVAEHDLERAVEVVRAEGWAPATKADSGIDWLHRVMRPRVAGLPAVELHWRIHWYEARFAAALLERTALVDGLRRLDPLDQFAALLLFYARDGFTGLRFPADIAAWWDRHGSPAVPDGLRRLMAEHPALAEPWRAALAAALAVAGLPGDVALPGCLPRARRSALAVRLTNWDRRGEADQIRANVSLIDGLLAPPGDLPTYLRRQVFPPLSALGGAYPSAAGSRLRSGGYRALHTGKRLARYGVARWRLRGGRSWSPGVAVLPARADRRG